MTHSLPRDLRAARLRALGVVTAHVGDLGEARDAVDRALVSLDEQEPPADLAGTLLEIAWATAGRTDPVPHVAEDDASAVLSLLAACCHSSLPMAARIALMLAVAGGFPTDEIARAFAVPDQTMERRLAWSEDRARALLGRVIPDELTAEPLDSVLDVLMLVFDDGIIHPHCHLDLPYEAVETTRVLVEQFPAESEPRAALAIMLLTRARRDARVAPDGSLIPFGLQDRSRWHRDEIDEGLFLLRASRRQNPSGPYQIRATIQSEHVNAPSAEDTDWDRILALHDQLMTLAPSDLVALSRATALAEVRGAEAALKVVEGFGLDSHLYHATRADLLSRLGHQEEADRAWTAAVARVRSAREHARLRGTLEG
ncbi:RNA polymerase sigma factor [Aeromicrobium duanguangcaii]|uniref:RNA polymerase sigma factor n=2 Tax=Aeromicrobium duanguangcaii TaxID=2968086 RepID=A0ABY5KMY2_9ACTN|nr:DUF6596 domain-containing protein [Aeromicrobium duanguangcaii]MCL3836805.1 RNA polymerase sigma factor [Aeromicrobium duanguangcaii]UUI69698.1 RNA polymerase sigma factor [Aeromicrobium duanguangcaii]